MHSAQIKPPTTNLQQPTFPIEFRDWQKIIEFRMWKELSEFVHSFGQLQFDARKNVFNGIFKVFHAFPQCSCRIPIKSFPIASICERMKEIRNNLTKMARF